MFPNKGEIVSFDTLGKVMQGNDTELKQLIQKAFKSGLFILAELLGPQFALLKDGLELTDDMGLLDSMTQNVVDFFDKRKKAHIADNAQAAHVLMLLSAYFDTVKELLPADYPILISTAREQHSIAVKTAADLKIPEEAFKQDLSLPEGMPIESLNGLKYFYALLSEYCKGYLQGLDLEEWRREKIERSLEAAPEQAVQALRKQYIALSASSNAFFVSRVHQEHQDIYNALLRVLADNSELKKRIDALMQQTAAPRYSLPAVPAVSRSFVEGSRDREIGNAMKALDMGQNVFLWGVGGIGKTETAIQIAVRWQGEKGFVRYSLPFQKEQEAMEETVLRMELEDYKYRPSEEGMDIAAQRKEEFSQRLSLLKNRFPGALLVIDNFDRPGKTLADLQEEASFKALCKAGLKLIFTTRSVVENKEWEILPLTEEQLLVLMRRNIKIYVPEDSLLALIREVKGHTLMAELMAKTLEESWGDITPEAMLAALKKKSLPQQDYPEVQSTQNHDYQQRQLYAHLAALFDLTGMEEAARAVLRCATLLPEGGMDPKLFIKSLEKDQQAALKKLEKLGWLQKRELLSIHPLIRQVCRGELKPTDESCGGFLEGLWEQYDKKKYDHILYRQMADCFAAASDALEDGTGDWAENAGFLYLVLSDHQAALAANLKAVAIREKVLPPEHPILASSYNNVGSTYYQLGDLQKALEFSLKALAIWEKVLPPGHPSLATSYNNVGMTYYQLGNLEKGLEFSLKALAIREKVLPPEHPDLAGSYNNVGVTYSKLGDHEKALEYSLKALAIREKVLPPEHPDLAGSYNNVGYTYGELGDRKKALEFMHKAIKILEQKFPKGHPNLLVMYQNIAMVYIENGDIENALTYLLKSGYLPPDAEA